MKDTLAIILNCLFNLKVNICVVTHMCFVQENELRSKSSDSKSMQICLHCFYFCGFHFTISKLGNAHCNNNELSLNDDIYEMCVK